jgi:hypothetical protein
MRLKNGRYFGKDYFRELLERVRAPSPGLYALFRLPCPPRLSDAPKKEKTSDFHLIFARKQVKYARV